MRSAPIGLPIVLNLGLGALVATLLVGGCSSTQVTSTWTAPGGAAKPFASLVVFGVAANGKVRRAYEDNFVNALRARGVQARPGHALLPGGGLGDVKSIKQAALQSGADGVIVTHLVGERSRTVYVQPQNYVNPSLYGSLYPYYQRVYGYVTEPGYYARFPVLQLETNLYDTAREKLLWSARSQTMDPGSEDTTIKEVIAATTKGLAEAGFLPR
ncbi:MAG TPA: hypothetical protein VES73_02435 [Lamprocystis sp. (in: g-proteobacteria)]|nr:hypothetical protein [Lamprocystis sp. (in: g-proteobacteria)]